MKIYENIIGILSVCIIGYLPLFSQTPCITPDLPQNQMMGLSSKSIVAEEAYKAYIHQRSGSRDDQMLNIPVVVHILYPPGGTPGITKDQVLSKIAAINNGLYGQGVCPGDPDSEDMRISLYASERKPDNTPSETVYYYAHAQSHHNACSTEEPLYDIVRNSGVVYPTDQYLNIYVVESICAPCMSIGCHVAGYASYAPAHGMLHDGIVLERWLMEEDECTTIKVILHELGHYLNLLHTFSPGCTNDDCLEDGDKVCDTPPMTSQDTYPSHPCLQGGQINSCTTDVNPSDPNNPFLTDQPDASDNYMSYVPTGCMHRFTPGQKMRMRATLEETRFTLLRSRGCQEPCADPVVWNIISPDEVYAGEESTWMNQTAGTHGYMWEVEGEEIEGRNLIYRFDTSGVYQIKVYTTHIAENCADTLTFEVEVKCRIPEMSFTISAEVLEAGEEVQLINTSPLAPELTYRWIVEGNDFGMDDQLTLTLSDEGTYRVYLLGCNQYCCHRSASRMIRLGPCTEEQAGREWHFGIGVGLRFQENGIIEQVESSMLSAEASAIAYDEKGEVLFYSNGSRIWNRYHEIMANGTGLSGGHSATQVLTLRQPGSDDIWYLFYPDQIENVPEDDPNIKMYYSIIDMSSNGGLGEVVLKNELLFEYSTEKVTAIRHCNGIDWWVVMHELGSNNFRVYSLTDNGLNSNPMIQSIGSFIESAPYAAASYIRPNIEGDIISFIKGGSFGNTENSSLEFFRFDRESGILSDPLLIFNDRIGFYGAEFSPNNSKFYTTDSYSSFLHQFDISEWDAAKILESEYVFESFSLSNAGALCLGPDSTIYIATGQFFLHAILEPDLQAPNNQVIERFYYTGDQRVNLGLPNFPNDIYNTPKPNLRGPKEVCDTTTQAIYFVQSYCKPDDHEWSYRGGGSLSLLSGDSILIDFHEPGIDTLIVWKETACRIWSDTLLIQVAVCGGCNIEYTLAESDTLICRGETAYLRLHSNADSITLRALPDGEVTAIEAGWIDLGEPLTDVCYEIRFMIEEVCDSVHTICVQVNAEQEFAWIQADTVVCQGEHALIDIQSTATLIELLNEDLSEVITDPEFPLSLGEVMSDRCYWLRLRTPDLGCDAMIPFCVRVSDASSFEWIQADTGYCAGTVPLLTFEAAGVWEVYDSDGMLQSGAVSNGQITGLAAGCYTLSNTVAECGYSTPFCLQELPVPELAWVDSTGVICPGEQVDWEFDAFGAVVSVLTDTDTVELSGNRLEFPVLFEDMCIPLLVASGGCTSEVAACVTIDMVTPPTHEIITLCPGDSLQIDNQWMRPGDSYQLSIPVDGACDSVILYELLAFEEIVYELQTTPTCDDVASGTLEILSSNSLTVQWDHTTSDNRRLEGLSSGMYHATLTDDNGCETRVSTEVQEIPWIWPGLEIVSPGCGNDTVGSILLELVDLYTLVWNGQEVPGGRIEELPPGAYEVQLISQAGCSRDTMIIMESRSELEVRLPVGVRITEGTSIVLEVEVEGEGALSYLWNPAQWLSCVSCSNPVAQPQQTIIYTVEVTDAYGCSGKDSIEIVVDPDFPVYIPGAFSPNGDGVNDVFEVYSGHEHFELTGLEIYDRNGSKIYACQGIQCVWDGRFKGQLVQPGLYIYVVEVNTPEGVKVRSGEVVVMR